MEGPGVVISEARQVRTEPSSSFSYSRAAWTTVWWVGLLLIVAGFVDLSLALYPLQLGVEPWRFAALASVANGLPLPAVGIFAIAMAAVASERVGRARFALLLSALGAVALILLLIGFVTAIAPTVASASPDVRLGVKKSAFKTVLFAVTFAAGFGFSSVTVARWLRGQNG
jgi:hypothetical protein